jgi:adenosylcobinamide-phosphate synthase
MNDRDTALLILSIAASLDYLIGDPWGWIHPVQVMGWTIDRSSNFILNWSKDSNWRRLAGVVLAISVIGSSAIISWSAIELSDRLSPLFGSIVASILLASCFAGRSLRQAALDVLQPLSAGNLSEARSRLSRYVGRDTENLTEPEILRAVLETVGENATDGVMAPLFYALLGLLFPQIGSVPFAFAYKAASTLDSMVGYKEEPYTDLGWFSAKLEDGLTWLPCRLTVVTLGLLSGRLRRVWQTCRRDAVKDPSPNSGWSECAYATILGVQLGGTNSYRGVVKHKPLLGNPDIAISAETVRKALRLTRLCFLSWLAIAVVIFSSFARQNWYRLHL